MGEHEKGQYHGKLIKASFVNWGGNNTPCIQFEFQIGFFWQDEVWKPIDIITRHIRLFTTEKAWDYTEKKLEAMGFNGDFSNVRVNQELYSDGTPLKLTIKNDFDNWDFDGFGGSVAAEPAGKESVLEMSAKWKSNHKNTSPSPGNPPEQECDETPF